MSAKRISIHQKEHWNQTKWDELGQINSKFSAANRSKTLKRWSKYYYLIDRVTFFVL